MSGASDFQGCSVLCIHPYVTNTYICGAKDTSEMVMVKGVLVVFLAPAGLACKNSSCAPSSWQATDFRRSRILIINIYIEKQDLSGD